MMFRSKNVRFLTGFALAGFMLAVAGCQSGDSGILNLGGAKEKKPDEGKILASELLAYCPKVTLKEDTGYFNRYAKGGEDDPAKLIYQASISDVTRSCSRANGVLTMNVAVAGRIVPGPAGSPGTVTVPVRIVATHGEEVLYSQLIDHQVQVGSVATQFVIGDPNVTMPIPSDRGIQVFAGFDAGPPKKKQQEEAAF